MMKRFKLYLFFHACFLLGSHAWAQIPVEIFSGQQKTSFDLMFFRFFRNKDQAPSRFLFFNRNRVNIDYRMSQTNFLPVFGFTEALSYNHPRLLGFAPVIVAQVSTGGIYPKSGIQYYRHKKDCTFFSWVVYDVSKNTAIDVFILGRYEPRLTDQINCFTQLELVNAFPLESGARYNFFQRARLGLKIRDWQFGAGLDLNEYGRTLFTRTENIGAFLRHEF